LHQEFAEFGVAALARASKSDPRPALHRRVHPNDDVLSAAPAVAVPDDTAQRILAADLSSQARANLAVPANSPATSLLLSALTRVPTCYESLARLRRQTTPGLRPDANGLRATAGGRGNDTVAGLSAFVNKTTESCPILGAEWERRNAVRHGQKRSLYPTGRL
jgi:hypothetical protein